MLSLKCMKPGFLKQSLPSAFKPIKTVEEIRSLIYRSKKFVVGKELLNFEDDYNKTQIEVFDLDIDKISPGEKVPSGIMDKKIALWNAFSKLPFDVIFLENDSGGMLIEKVGSSSKLVIPILVDGKISHIYSLVYDVISTDNKCVQILTNEGLKEATMLIDARDHSTLWKKSLLEAQINAMIVLNALLHINAVNTNISKYAPSKRELTGFVTPVGLSKFDYHVVNIFTNKVKKYASLKEVEEYSQSNMHANVRAHMVRGHFKQRTSGIYWWNPFLRCKKNESFVDKHYEVK